MAFTLANLRPIGRNSSTGNVLWFYVNSADTVATMTATGYFTGVTGLAVNDVILLAASDGVAEIGVGAIAGTGAVTPTPGAGGAVAALDVTVDQTSLTEIGGGTLDANVQADLERIHNRLNLKFQRLENTGSGSAVFTGSDSTTVPFDKVGFMRRIAAGTGIDVSVVNDAIVISTAGSGGGDPGGGGGGSGTDGSLIPPPPADLGFDDSTRRVFVSKSGNNGNSGLSAGAAKLTIQAAINIAQPADTITIGDGTYRETLTLSSFAGTTSDPLWIVAENRGKVIVSNSIASIDAGTKTWTSQGGGVFSATGETRPFIGSHGNDFLMYYKSEADLRATAVSGVTKPAYGFAFAPSGGSTAEDSGGTLFVRLRNNVNPNGQKIKLTEGFSTIIFDLNNADNVIIDGLVFEGSGNAEAINADTNCANFVVRNCVFTHCRFGIRGNTGSLYTVCEYLYTGFGQWCKEVSQLDGINAGGVFTLLKDYYTRAVIGGTAGDALLEGGFTAGRDPTLTNVTVDRCLMGPAFDGNRIGENDNSTVQFSVYLQCRDDADQNESFRAANLSAGNKTHDCRMIDCNTAWSIQENSSNGDAFFYRNVVENRDPDFRHNNLFMLKTIFTSNNVDAFVWNNTFINIANNGAGSQFLWYDFNNGTGDRIRQLLNNIIIFQNAFSQSGGPNPAVINGNAVVGPSSGAVSTLTAGAGTFVGTNESDMGLNADLSLPATSPAAGIGVTLPSNMSAIDTGLNADDAGAFPVGVPVGGNWPREATRTFDLTKPDNWPF